ISPTESQAQFISIDAPATAAAIDLQIAAVSPSVRLQLDLRGDLDGKPDSISLLSKPVEFSVASSVEKQPSWISVPLPGKFLFEAATPEDKTRGRYWLVLQSLEGD